MCVFTLISSAFAFLTEMIANFKSLFAIWPISPERSHYYFNLNINSWQYKKYSTILILVLTVPFVCNAVGLLILFKLCPVFTFLQQLMTINCELFTHTLVLQCFPSTSSCQPQTTRVFRMSFTKMAGKWWKCDPILEHRLRGLAAWASHELDGLVPHQCR